MRKATEPELNRTYELRESSRDLVCRSRRNRIVFMVFRIFEETALEHAIVVRFADPQAEDED